MSTIKLNVGGKIFETTPQTLMLSEYFKVFLSRWNHNDTIFIDRSYEIFEHVLALLRDPMYDYPVKYASELDFYQIPNNIKEHINEMEKKIDEMTEQMNELNNQIKELKNQIKEIRYVANIASSRSTFCDLTCKCKFKYCYSRYYTQGYCKRHVDFMCDTPTYQAKYKSTPDYIKVEEQRLLDNLINKRIEVPIL